MGTNNCNDKTNCELPVKVAGMDADMHSLTTQFSEMKKIQAGAFWKSAAMMLTVSSLLLGACSTVGVYKLAGMDQSIKENRNAATEAIRKSDKVEAQLPMILKALERIEANQTVKK